MSFQLPEEIPGVTVTNFLKYAKNKVTGKPVKIFEFKEELAKYMSELNMNSKNMERSLNVGFSGGEKKKNEILQMTHNTKILHSLKVDYVHILVNGKIVKTGSQELAKEIEENGYSEYK